MNKRTVTTIARQALAAVIITGSAIGMWGLGHHQGTTEGEATGRVYARQLADAATAKARAEVFCPGCTVRVETWRNDTAQSGDTWETFPDGYRQRTQAWGALADVAVADAR